ncbi:pirin family protein [Phenylobacterium hankyongense]|uniref:Pirin family protein n=1 Tax=Phenylobacterium hankyongense TaxID=1813876 RepID=A0A328ATR0_9CAUL|nr:pirin family protein [Phenylobacterium hankyongense]RAK58360.1 pirin family protein [Phenylobacterium hankyongense]
MPAKTVIAQHAAYRDDIGDLITRRPVPGPGVEQVDPFLFLNHHGPQTYGPDNNGLPFGPHPHRGFETVTFILDGELAHRDSAGHESVIRAGGVQWMTAGSGLVHEEVSPEDFKRQGGPMEILQLWVNLPGRLKMSTPHYVGVQADQIPALTADQGRATVNLISGAWGGQTGPISSLTGIFMTTIDLKAAGRVGFGSLAGRNVFLYVVRGQVGVNGIAAAPWNLVQLDLDGDMVEIVADEDAFVVFGHGEPINEPVVAHGPFVMNTREEIVQAIRDYQAGLFDAVSA